MNSFIFIETDLRIVQETTFRKRMFFQINSFFDALRIKSQISSFKKDYEEAGFCWK